MTNKDLLKRAMAPKSDQLNADDLIAGARTINITGVRVNASGEQLVSIFYEGDAGKPWKPSKGMMRVLAYAWGEDPDQWPGRFATLFNDPEVTFGPDKTGGIRISHLSHIQHPINIAITMKKGKRKPVTILPLQLTQPAPSKGNSHLKAWGQQIKNASLLGVASLQALWLTVPVELQPELQAFYNERLAAAKQIDYEKSQQPVGFNPAVDETPPQRDEIPLPDEAPENMDSMNIEDM